MALSKTTAAAPKEAAPQKPMTDNAVMRRIARMDGWTYENGVIQRAFKFDSQEDAAKFIRRVSRKSMNLGREVYLRLHESTVGLILRPGPDGFMRGDFSLAKRLAGRSSTAS